MPKTFLRAENKGDDTLTQFVLYYWKIHALNSVFQLKVLLNNKYLTVWVVKW